MNLDQANQLAQALSAAGQKTLVDPQFSYRGFTGPALITVTPPMLIGHIAKAIGITRDELPKKVRQTPLGPHYYG